jgi:acetyl esterase/lipase
MTTVLSQPPARFFGHRITNRMMHPQLRLAGATIRAVMPSFTDPVFRIIDAVIAPMKGHSHSGLRYEQHFITRDDGSQLRLCVYASQQLNEGVPGLLWLHGGGYRFGAPEADEGSIKRFVEASGCVVVSPDYRLSLQAPYPAAFDDSYAALLWLKEHGSDYGMRSDQIMVGGDSAGGGLCAAVTLKARDTDDVAVAFQMPLYPMLDDRMTTTSMQGNDAPLLNEAGCELAWRLYLGDLYGSDDVPAYAAPGRATDLSGLPETVTFVGSIDPFRDETVHYVQALRAGGVRVHARVYFGCFHGFDVIGRWTRPGRNVNAFLMDTFWHAVATCFAPQTTN